VTTHDATLINHKEDLLQQWSELDTAERLQAFQSLPHNEADRFFLALSTWDQAALVEAMPEEERRLWLRHMPPDDAADVIQASRPELRESFLDQIDETTRKEVRALMAYKQDVAGGRMSPRFARVRPEMTVDEAIAYLRLQAGHVETIHYAYVVDEDGKLRGVLSFRKLFAADRHTPVSSIMRTHFVCVTDSTDQEEVARLVRRHHLFAVPVVDGQQRMRGIVTVDDIVSVLQQEASEDIQRLGGSEFLDRPYLEVGFLQMVRKRAGWLAVLFLGEMLTASAMSFFEEEIAKAVVLALFLPLIISSGGNSGSQASTLLVRAIALGEVRLRDWLRVVSREILAGVALGSVLACIGLLRILVWQHVRGTYGPHYLPVAFTIAASLVGVVTFGTFAGSMLPFILRRFGLDPASASAPFVATLVDVTGLVIYFNLARLILRGSLL
jgi:magnesium transporter